MRGIHSCTTKPSPDSLREVTEKGSGEHGDADVTVELGRLHGGGGIGTAEEHSEQSTDKGTEIGKT